MEPGMFQDTKGNYFETELHPYLVETELFESDSIRAVSDLPDTRRVFFPYQYTTNTNVDNEQNLVRTAHPRHYMKL